MYLISLFSGIYICFFYSYLIFRKVNFHEFFITLFAISSPIPLLAYKNAFLVKHYIYFLFIFSFSFLIYLFFRFFFKENINFKKIFEINKNIQLCKIKKYLINNKFIIVFSLIITSFISYKILPFQWRFEDHDLFYFAWVNDIFDIKYKGPIRLSIAFPYQLSAMNLQAGSYLAPFLIFTKNNIYNTYTTKFFLLLVSQFYLIYLLLKKIFIRYSSNWQYIFFSIPFLGILFFFTFYSYEINYSQSISNYGLLIYILNLTSLCIRFSFIKKVNEHFYFFNLFILNIICLTSFKASTFPTLILTILFFAYILKRQNLINLLYRSIKKYYFLIFSLPVISLLGWLSQQSNHGSLSSIFPICLKNDITLCTYSLFNNPFQGWWPQEDFKLFLLKNSFTDSITGLYEYIYIWFVVILPSLVLSYYLIKRTENLGFKIFGYFNISYVLSSALSILFIRESISFKGIHVAHSYLIIPFFTIASFCLILLNKEFRVIKSKKNKFFIFILIMSLITINHFNDSVNKGRIIDIKTFNSSNHITMTFNESKKFFLHQNSVCTTDQSIIDKFTSNHIDINGCGNNEIKTLYSALSGLRSKAGYSNYLLKNFLITK